MDFKFSEIEPDKDMLFVASPQISAHKNEDSAWIVDVLFMENSAAVLTEGTATAKMGNTVLGYKTEFLNGLALASVKLFKVRYVFTDSDGMPTKFEFDGGKSVIIRRSDN